VSIVAHGIGGVQDLPVPASFFYATATIVLVVSFVLLGALWKRPVLEPRAAGRSVPGWLESVVFSRALRVALQIVSVALLFLVLTTAFVGTTITLLNFAPTFVFVVFWLGLPLLSVTLGNVWTVLSPWRAIADFAVWMLEWVGYEAKPLLDTRWTLGRYPAAAALFAFVALELAHPQGDDPRVLAVAVSVYTYWALAGMAVYGRDAWTRGGEGFAVAFELLSRIAPFAVRDGRLVIRWPLTGLTGADHVRGTLVFVAVMLGSTSFDGFSRWSIWQDFVAERRAELAGSSLRVVDLVLTLVNMAGLAFFVAAVVITYSAATLVARRLVHATRSLVPDFVLPLVPIAFAYIVAHYFSLFVVRGQFVVPLISDPFGRGWDLFGTVDWAPDIAIVSTQTVWYVQCAALTLGHVAALAVAHDRAVAMFERRSDALRSQYPMLALMILYTLGGMWLLSQR
jgi:hypothetical protein